MKTALSFVLAVTVALIVIDALCALFWFLSGQTPVFEFYFGALTTNAVLWIFQ